MVQKSTEPAMWNSAAWQNTGEYVFHRRLQYTESSGTIKPQELPSELPTALRVAVSAPPT